MSYVSFLFCIFFAVILLLYYVLPRKTQWILLLIGSLIFYAYSSWLALPVLVLETLVIWALARKMERTEQKRKYVVGIVVLALAILFLLLYLPSLVEIPMLRSENAGIVSLLLAPLGISYYTLMIISYGVDVSRGDIPAEQNFARLLLFALYFPSITQGPMNRYCALSAQFRTEHAFDKDQVWKGLIRFIYGAFKKLVVANRVAAFIAAVNQNEKAAGVFVLMSLLLFMLQLYSDFSGCADMAIGMSMMLGIKVPENFRHPYRSRSISEYWRRWHLTLGAWLKDYIYYPIIMSTAAKKWIRAGEKKKKQQRIKAVSCIALFVLWMAMGIWHGPGLMFVMMGLQYAVTFIATYLLEPVSKRFAKAHPVWEENFFWKYFQKFRTNMLLWPVFLCVQSFAQLGSYASRIFTDFRIEKFFDGGLLKFDLDTLQWILLIIGALTIAVVSAIEEKTKKQLPELLQKQKFPVRLVIYWFVILMILLSLNIQNTEFIYAQY